MEGERVGEGLAGYLWGLEQWRDDAQARSLLGPFNRPRSVNPEAWDARYQFWRQVIVDATRRRLLGTSCLRILHPATLPSLFQRNQSVPLGIHTVLEEMRREKILSGEGGDDHQESLLARLAKLAINVGWRWTMMGGEGGGEEQDEQFDDERGEGKLKDDQYDGARRSSLKQPLIVNVLLKELAEDVIKYHGEKCAGSIPTVISWRDFVSLVQGARKQQMLPPLTDEADFELLLQHMRKDRLVAVRESEDGRVMALRIKVASQRTGGGLTEIKEEEVNIIRLRQIHDDLQAQLEHLSMQIDQIKTATRLALRRQDRVLAMHELKRAKLFEQFRDQRLAAFSTIQTILLKIEAAQSDAQVLSAYDAGERALRGVLQAEGMTAERADNLLASLEQAMADQGAIAAAISMPLNIPGVLEDDLERELADLVLEEEPTTRAETAIIPPEGSSNIKGTQPIPTLPDPVSPSLQSQSETQSDILPSPSQPIHKQRTEALLE